jgi:hypothetical protein
MAFFSIQCVHKDTLSSMNSLVMCTTHKANTLEDCKQFCRSWIESRFGCRWVASECTCSFNRQVDRGVSTYSQICYHLLWSQKPRDLVLYELENEVEHNVQMGWTTLEISYCWSCLYVLVGSNKHHNLHYVRRWDF